MREFVESLTLGFLTLLAVLFFTYMAWGVHQSLKRECPVTPPMVIVGCEITFGPLPAKEGYEAYGVVCPIGEKP